MYNLIIKLRSRMLVYLTHRMALPVLQRIRKPEYFPYSAADLQKFPRHSLGNDLVRFLHRKDLKLLPYYAKHDIKHILLQYDTTDKGEVCLQCFMLGNRHLSFPVAATVLYGIVTMPEYWKSFYRAFIRGKKCVSICKWNWHLIVWRPTAELQHKIDHRLNDTL